MGKRREEKGLRGGRAGKGGKGREREVEFPYLLNATFTTGNGRLPRHFSGYTNVALIPPLTETGIETEIPQTDECMYGVNTQLNL